MAVETIEEAKYFQAEKQKAAKKLLSEGVNEMIMLMLRKAFTEGYNAKDRYKKKNQIDCKCACHKTKDKEKGTCGKCYTIQCSWWEGKNFEYADSKGLWVGKKERNR